MRHEAAQDGGMRCLLLASTALLIPFAAQAQAPSARPQGGQVVAGSATIAQTPARTQVNQASDRAVIEWRGFDIGSAHQVDIRQPGPGSWSLQRVTGPDPSAIAGRLTSNGGVAIVNPAGVMFHNGAQVDVASLIATASDTANQSFMAGRMTFDGAPRPGARVENRGTITVRDQGLAALVGPVAANSGTIRARLGRVAIAGAEAATIDLAGDGLLSLDVTHLGPLAATNTGRIEAVGGEVLITAATASDLVESVVSAGGAVTAGRLTANVPNGTVTVPGNAVLEAGRLIIGAGAGSRIGAARDLAARSTVAPGATLRAERGGTVIVHAARGTEMRGRIDAPGGEIEVSSRGALALDGALDAARILVDPQELRIVQALTGSTEPAEITAATVNAASGTLTLSAERSIRVLAPVNRSAGPLVLETTNATAVAGDGISIERAIVLAGDLTLRSAGDITQAASGARLNVGTLFAESRAGAVRLDAGTNTIRGLAGGGAATGFAVASLTGLPVDGAIAATEIALTSGGAITLRAGLDATRAMLSATRGIGQDAAAPIRTGSLALAASDGAVALGTAGNRIASLGEVLAPRGLILRNDAALRVDGALSGAVVTLRLGAGDLMQGPAGSLVADRLVLELPGGGALLDGTGNRVARLAGSARDALVLSAGRDLVLDGPVTAARVALTARGDLSQETDALLVTPRLEARSIGGAVLLQDPLNRVDALGAGAADTSFALANAGTLRLLGGITAPEVTLTPGGALRQDGGAILAGRLRVNALTGDVALDGAGNRIATLLPSGAAGRFALRSELPLAVAGALDAGGALTLDAPSLRLSSTIDAPSMTLGARAGDVVQAGGRISTASLRAEATGEVRLEEAGNAIGAIAGRAGPLFAAATASALALGDLAATEVALGAGGDVTQAGAGGIVADLLRVSAGGSLRLDAAANAIRALGVVTAPGGLVLRSATAVELTAPLDVPTARFEAGGLTQRAGATLAAGTLALAAGGEVRLDEPGNAVPRLLASDLLGGLALTTSGDLVLDGTLRSLGAVALLAGGEIRQVAGFVQAPLLGARAVLGGVTLEGPNLLGAVAGGAAGGWRLRDIGIGTLRLGGLLAAPEVALTLNGGLVEASGALRTEALALDLGGAAELAGANHRVAALSGRAAGLRLAAGGPLAIADALEIGGALALQADTLSLAAPVSAGSALLIAPAGDVAQAAGVTLRLTGPLDVHAAGSVALAEAGNLLPRLAGGSAGQGFALGTGGALLVAGAVEGATVVLRSAGEMRLDGAAFIADRTVLLATPSGLAAGARSTLAPRDPGLLPVLVMDTRAAPLPALPDVVQPDLPGVAPAAQPTQLAGFGAAVARPGGGAAFDIAAGASPVFLLLDGAPAVGTIEAGRLGLLAASGSAFLVGTVGGLGGAAAAALVAVPSGATGYSLNGCAMGLSSCGQAPVLSAGLLPGLPVRLDLVDLGAPLRWEGEVALAEAE
jgi:filamentous hemagglutinin family protein